MNKNIISAVVSGGLFLLLILLVSFVDVQTVPATGMEMGLSHINFAFSNLIGVNPLLYKLTTVLGIFLILVVVWFGLKGLMQLIHRKSLLKVDREILTLESEWPRDVTVMQWALYDTEGKLLAEAKTDISKATSQVQLTFHGEGSIEKIEESFQ